MFGSSTRVQCTPTETHVPGGELVERTMVSAKFDDANLEFLDMWSRLQKPYAVSQSSLVNLAVSIVRKLVTNDAYSKIKDRKSTRLNSSHVAISYAVFCLKKKINE